MQETRDLQTPRTLASTSPRSVHPQPEQPIGPCSGIRNLERQLDQWCRENGARTSMNSWIAERAHHELAAPTGMWRSVEDKAYRQHHEILPDQLRTWPASWRYRVADLERGGVPRSVAIQRVRLDHGRGILATDENAPVRQLEPTAVVSVGGTLV